MDARLDSTLPTAQTALLQALVVQLMTGHLSTQQNRLNLRVLNGRLFTVSIILSNTQLAIRSISLVSYPALFPALTGSIFSSQTASKTYATLRASHAIHLPDSMMHLATALQ